MLQQTRTEAVKGYYARFLERFPDAGTLADSALDEVYKLWEGLGYYSRARNIHRAAQEIVTKYDGNLPRSAEGLLALPGIGNYASGAIASIAFGERVPALDGNQVRVLTRLFSIHTPIKTPMDLYPLALSNMPEERCGDYNQALMDLGATICTPGTPACEKCPLREYCDAYTAGDAEDLPVLPRKNPPKVINYGVFLIFSGNRVLMRQRTETMLKGLWVFPMAEGTFTVKQAAAAAKKLTRLSPGAATDAGSARHVFTHQIWQMQLFAMDVSQDVQAPPGYSFIPVEEMDQIAIPTAVKAAVAAVRKRQQLCT